MLRIKVVKFKPSFHVAFIYFILIFLALHNFQLTLENKGISSIKFPEQKLINWGWGDWCLHTNKQLQSHWHMLDFQTNCFYFFIFYSLFLTKSKKKENKPDLHALLEELMWQLGHVNRAIIKMTTKHKTTATTNKSSTCPDKYGERQRQGASFLLCMPTASALIQQKCFHQPGFASAVGRKLLECPWANFGLKQWRFVQVTAAVSTDVSRQAIIQSANQ